MASFWEQKFHSVISLLVVLMLVETQANENSIWTHACQNKFCRRTVATPEMPTTSLAVCKLNCDSEAGSLFPLPRGNVRLGSGLVGIQISGIIFVDEPVALYPDKLRSMLSNAVDILKENLGKMLPQGKSGTNLAFSNQSLNLCLTIRDTEKTMLSLDTDESYNLTITAPDTNDHVTANIDAGTFYGVRHGLETLSQLIAYDEVNDIFKVVSSVNISDSPAYQYRGILLDTSRNFISVAGLKRLIDGMSANKLNMFHWHITDTHAFPMQVDGYPEFTDYGAYSPSKIYTLEDMKDLVAYARVRGVKIVPEFDQPSHMGFGWQWGRSKGLEDLVVCLNKEPWYKYCVEPPCGQINIVNNNIYPLIRSIFDSMFSIFDDDLFHMGGDEVHIVCYNSTEEITKWMDANGYPRNNWDGFVRLWGDYQNKAHSELVNASSNPSLQTIMWTSELTMKDYVGHHLNKEDYIIQTWTDSKDKMISDLLDAGYRMIFSNYDALYLDCGFQAWIGGPGHNWCPPYKTWQKIYDNSPYRLYAKLVNSTDKADKATAQGLILGGEVALWTEQADEEVFESRIFPRASAHAERMWTNPNPNEKGSWADAEFRMITNRERLVQRGVRADRLQPEFCSMYQNNCYATLPQSHAVHETSDVDSILISSIPNSNQDAEHKVETATEVFESTT